jgi:hypothetical protein
MRLWFPGNYKVYCQKEKELAEREVLGSAAFKRKKQLEKIEKIRARH